MDSKVFVVIGMEESPARGRTEITLIPETQVPPNPHNPPPPESPGFWNAKTSAEFIIEAEKEWVKDFQIGRKVMVQLVLLEP